MPSELTKILRQIDEAELQLKVHKQKMAGLIVGNFLLTVGGTWTGLNVPATTPDGSMPLAAIMFGFAIGLLLFNIGMGVWISSSSGAAKRLRNARYKHIDFLEDQGA